MKKILIIGIQIVLIVVIFLTIYNNDAKNNEQNQENNEQNQESNESKGEENLTSKIRLMIDDEEIIVALNNSEASKEFERMLPLTLTFEDYNNVEKIAYLPSKLDTTNSPDGYDPEISDFSYYVPWGNLSIFYKDFRYSNSLVKLGTIESGIEKIADLNGEFTVTIEKID